MFYFDPFFKQNRIRSGNTKYEPPNSQKFLEPVIDAAVDQYKTYSTFKPLIKTWKPIMKLNRKILLRRNFSTFILDKSTLNRHFCCIKLIERGVFWFYLTITYPFLIILNFKQKFHNLRNLGILKRTTDSKIIFIFLKPPLYK